MYAQVLSSATEAHLQRHLPQATKVPVTIQSQALAGCPGGTLNACTIPRESLEADFDLHGVEQGRHMLGATGGSLQYLQVAGRQCAKIDTYFATYTTKVGR